MTHYLAVHGRAFRHPGDDGPRWLGCRLRRHWHVVELGVLPHDVVDVLVLVFSAIVGPQSPEAVDDAGHRVDALVWTLNATVASEKKYIQYIFSKMVLPFILYMFFII